ncbi:Glutaredoxin domain-containing protein [Cephalotus follicularis]|uniref:Glutaredoxin domain-containing protein n=1 Tax=Cephalotus follicularis TaxID=3775 RepID=A0A1Q3B7A2_CEPFO|nr:Glutaredoxin domain-containing protein [Cephalotus follicularis]
MQGVKGGLAKKLNFIQTISTLKQSLALLIQSPQIYEEEDNRSNNLPELAVGYTSVSDHVRDVKVEELEFNVSNKENVILSIESKGEALANDNTDFTFSTENSMERNNMHEAEEDNESNDGYLLDFEEKCPPGGEESVILYTTSLRGIRKTFEDCHSIRILLENMRVLYNERDVSFHMEYREELWTILDGRVVPPRLFIKGRYIGGADEVVKLHEQGKLKKLLEGIAVQVSNCLCGGCGNMRFVVCLNCNGSRKIFAGGEGDEFFIRCHECNENGLVKCLIC